MRFLVLLEVDLILELADPNLGLLLEPRDLILQLLARFLFFVNLRFYVACLNALILENFPVIIPDVLLSLFDFVDGASHHLYLCLQLLDYFLLASFRLAMLFLHLSNLVLNDDYLILSPVDFFYTCSQLLLDILVVHSLLLLGQVGHLGRYLA